MSPDATPSPGLPGGPPAGPAHGPITPAGILVIDKDRGYTSMDVCAIVRGRLRRAGAPKRIKVGHAGTLDPMATGVLVVLVGRATRLSDSLMAGEKEYEAEIDLSATSTTDDAEGVVTPVDAGPVAREDVQRAAGALVGTILQRPPRVSAVHVGGRRAYDLARRGAAFELAPRPVVVHAFDVLDYTWPRARVRVACGKGTYVRSLARDLGVALGAGGMLTALRRTRVGAYTIAMARRLDDLPDRLTGEDLAPTPPPAS